MLIYSVVQSLVFRCYCRLAVYPIVELLTKFAAVPALVLTYAGRRLAFGLSTTLDMLSAGFRF